MMKFFGSNENTVNDLLNTVHSSDWLRDAPMSELLSKKVDYAIDVANRLTIEEVKAHSPQIARRLYNYSPEMLDRIIPALSERGFDINAVYPNTNDDRDQRTLLHWLASDGASPSIQMVLKHGGDINARSGMQDTPLHRAVRALESMRMSSRLDVKAPIYDAIETLIVNHAEMTVRTHDGQTAAALSTNSTVLAIIQHYGGDIEPALQKHGAHLRQSVDQAAMARYGATGPVPAAVLQAATPSPAATPRG